MCDQENRDKRTKEVDNITKIAELTKMISRLQDISESYQIACNQLKDKINDALKCETLAAARRVLKS